MRETFPSLALFTPENAQDWIDQAQNHFEGTQYAFKIIDAEGEFVGENRLRNVIRTEWQRSADINYWIREKFLHQGAATESFKQIVQFAFEELKLWRLEIWFTKETPSGFAFAEKMGAKFEGQLRNYWNFNGKMISPYLYSLLPDDVTF